MFWHILKKEFILISRDIHALLVLFIMPTLFIVIMSLALQNAYSDKIGIVFKVAVDANSSEAKKIAKSINSSKIFKAEIKEGEVKSLIYKEGYDIVIKLQDSDKLEIDMYTNPSLSYQSRESFKSLLKQVIAKDRLEKFFTQHKLDPPSLDIANSIVVEDVYRSEDFAIKPTSVQQSVPAWLIFSMFFILIPISNTFINERNFGTISRIKSMDVSFSWIIFGKIVPYFIINQIQVGLMIAVGIYLVPLLNGDSLQINGNYALIFLAGSAVSLAAISFAMLIANISNTSEQATTIGGVSNIILAALAGIMVPKYVMPEFMQNATIYSPMNWGLEAFLEIFVLGGGFFDIALYLLYLLIFAVVCLGLSFMILKKREGV